MHQCGVLAFLLDRQLRCDVQQKPELSLVSGPWTSNVQVLHTFCSR